MSIVSYEIPMFWNNFYKENSRTLVFTPQEIIEQFLWGIPLCNQMTGQRISDETIKQKILAAQKMLENYLGIKIFKQVIRETKDFVREEFMQWGFIKTSHRILKPLALNGNINGTATITYPKEWLTVKKSSDGEAYNEVQILPNGFSSANMNLIGIQYGHYFTFSGQRIIPNYWDLTYITGFETIPEDIINIIGKIASIQLLPIIEMSIGSGGNPSLYGMVSQSVSLDGLSQSVSKIGGGNIFTNRLKQYAEEIKIEMVQMKHNYVGVSFDVM